MTPLSPADIRCAIVDRVCALSESCSESHDNHMCGVVRGLLWALTGSDPGSPPRNLDWILTKAGVTFTASAGKIEIPQAWLDAHGLDADLRPVPHG